MRTSLPLSWNQLQEQTKSSKNFLSLIFGLSLFLIGLLPSASMAQTISNVSVSPSPVCAGSDVTVTFDVTNGGAGLHYTNSTVYQAYLSNTGGGFPGTTLGGTFTLTAAYNINDAGQTNGLLSKTFTIPAGLATGTYQIAIGSTGPAYAANAGQNASAAFSINAQVAPSVSISASPGTTICAGTNVILTATPTNGGTTPGYQWKKNGADIIGATGSTYSSSTLVNTDKITVVLTPSAEVCPSPATATSNELTMTVNPLLTPSVNISASATSICSGASVTFTAAVPANGGLTPAYQWQLSTNGGSIFNDISGATSSTYSTNTLLNGYIVRLKLTSSETCTSTNPVYSSPITITVNPDATISLTSGAGSNNQAVCAGAGMNAITFGIAGGGTGAGATGLPAGVSGTYSGGVFTISGTPTTAGTYNYTVTTTGTCAQANATGIITVNPNATITLTSAGGTNGQVKCINTAITNITYAIAGGGTGAGVTGLPTGVSGNYSGGVFTISGTPTVTGTFNYIVTTTGSCSQVTASGSITVNPDATISLTSGAGSNNQAVCAGAGMNAITFGIAGGGTGAGATGLPAGVSGTYSGGVFTISGTPTTAGTYNYTVTTTGTCAQANATGIITVNPNATITLTSAGGTNGQVKCINTAITNITYAIAGGGTGAGVTGLPTGVSGNYSGGVFTISGTPTVTGTFNYIVTTTGSCSQVTASGSITVNPDATISLTSGAGSNNQAVCAGAGMNAITFGIAGGGTGAGATGLPAGVSGTYSGGVFTISGTPTTAGTYNYTVTTTGTCAQANATGIITVNPNATITLTSAGGTNGQVKCINTAITNITYAIAGGGTGAGVTGLPTGVSGNYSGGVFTISGTPTVTGTFNYIVTTTGSCSQVTASGSITVNPDATISLTSGAGSNNQAVCAGAGMNAITFGIAGGGTGAGATGLPAGVSGTYSGGVFTISGTPTTAGTYNYTVTTTGTCAQANATGIITVNPNATITLTSAGGTNGQVKCINTAITNITYAIAGGGTGAGVTGLPTGVSGNYSGGVFTISGTPTVTGTFNYIVTTTGSCSQVTAAGSITVNPDATLTLTSAAATTNQNVCVSSPITTITYTLSGTTNYSITGLPTGVTASLSGTTLTISGSPSAAASTYNYTLSSTGVCQNQTVSGSIKVWSGNPNFPGGTKITTSASSICPPGNLTLTLTNAAANAQYYDWAPYLPSGWVIVSGNFTTSIVVNVTTAAQIGNQNVGVRAVNPCGNDAVTTNGKFVNVNDFNGVTVGSSTQAVCSDGTISVVGTLTGNASTGTWTAPSGSFSNIITSGGIPTTVSATYTPSITTGVVNLTITTNTPTGGGCPNVAGTAVIALTVNQKVAITAQPLTPQTLCTGGTATFSVTATGTGLTYQWRKGTTNLTNGGNISGATTATLTLSNLVAGDAGNYNVVVSGTAPCGPVTSSDGVLTVNSAINITAQPASITRCTGTNAVFTTTATGSSLTYQWRKGTTNLANGGNISGATTSTLTLSNVVLTDAGDYNVVITGASPCAPVTSGNATLTVNEAVAITVQPLTPQTLCTGGTATFSVTATGTGLTYQWRKGTTNLTNGGNISGATTATLTLSNLVAGDAGNYNVVVSGTAPCGPVTSSDGVLTVNSAINITAQPASITRCTGTNAVFTTTATGSSLTYQWRKGTTNLANGGNISGATTSTLTLSNVVLTDAGDYNVVITGASPCAPVTSGNATLTVNEAVAITVQPLTPQTLCTGGTASFSVSASGTGLTYQWRKGTTNLTNGGNISGATTATLTLSNLVAADAGSYNVVVSGTAPCGPVTSSDGVLTVNSAINITAQPASITRCTGTNAVFTTTATGSSLTYQWRKGTTNLANGGNISGATTSTLTLSNVVLTDAGDYNVVITGASPCAPVTSGNATLTVNEAVAITVQPLTPQTLCTGGTASFSVTASGTGLTYQWRKGTTNLTNGGNISGATTATLTLSNLVAADAGSYNVVVSGTAPCGPVTSSDGVLTVNSAINITAQPASITRCTGTNAVFTTTATGSSLTYQWRKGATNLANGGNISGATTSTLTLSNVVLTDAGDYNVVITGASPCAPVTSGNATLTVNEAVAITVQPLTPQTLCTGGTASFSVSASGTGLTYQWRKGTTNLTNGGNISGATTATLTLSNLVAADAGSYNVVVSGTAPCGPVTSSDGVLTVNVAVAINTQPINVGVCASSPASFGAVASGGIVSYQWYKGTYPGTLVSNSATITGATSNILNFSQVSVSDAGIYYLQVNGASPCTPVRSTEVTLNVSQSIVISTQPTSQVVCENQPVSFSVVASAGGAGLSYQWRKNGAAISGATSDTYTIGSLTTADAGSYDVVITGPSGFTCPTVTSTAAVLMINTLPAITTQPSTTNQVWCLGQTATTLSVVASGTGLSYQWYSNTTNSNSGGISISGATSAGYTPSTAVAGTLYYYVIVSGTCTPAVTSAVSGSVLVNTAPAITAQPSSTGETICQNAPATQLSVTATGTGLSYQWYRNTTNSTTGGTTVGTNTNTYTPVTTTAGTFYYYVTVSGTCPSPVTSTISGAIVVNAPPAITTQPSVSAQTPCQNTSATALSVVATGNGLTYQWYSNTTNSNTGGTLISGATNASYTPSTAVAGTLYYYVIVSGTCTPAVTSAVSGSVLVNTAPAITAQPSSTGETICQNAPATQLSVTATGTGLSYQWYRNTTNSTTGGTMVGTNTNTYTPVTTTAGTFYYYVTVSGTCPSPVTSTISGAIVVNAPPAITTQPSTTNQVWCLGQTATTLSVVASGTGLSYQWYSNTTNSNSGGISISGATSAGYTPSTAVAGTLYYYVIVSGTCTPAVTSAVSGSVLVNTAPAITAQPSSTGETICQNAPATQLSVTATGTGLSYQWYRNTTNSTTGGTTVGTNTNTYTPVTTTAGTFYYYVTVSGTCPSPVTSTISGAIVVNAPPAITTQPSVSAQTPCQNTSATALSVVAVGNGLTYQWYSNTTNSNTGGTLISGATNASYTPSTVIAGVLYYYVTITGTCTPSVKSNVSGSVTVRAIPTISVQPSSSLAAYCLNGTATPLSVTASGFNVTYQWYKNAANSNTGGTIITGATAATYTPLTNTAGTSYYYVVVSGGCAPSVTSSVSGGVQIDPTSVGGTLTIQGATAPTNVKEHCLNASGVINLTGQTGAVKRWQMSTDGGATWPAIEVTTTSLAYSGVNVTTLYRAVLLSGTCDTAVSAVAVVSVIVPVDPSPITANPTTICLGAQTTLTANTGLNQSGSSVDGTFGQANPAGWQVRINGVPNNFPANANNSVTNEWSESNGPKTFFGSPDPHPAITYDNNQAGIGGKFAIATGAILTSLETPIFSLVGTPTAALTLYTSYNFNAASSGSILISTNGGATYQPIPLMSIAGGSSAGNPINGWVPLSIDLSNYIGQNNLRIKFDFKGQPGTTLSTWAMDGITLPSNAPAATYTWSPATNLSSSTGSPVTATPTTSGTKTYTLTSKINGCTGGSGTVSVTVNDTASITTPPTLSSICASPGGQTVSLPYSAPSFGPTKYSISWNAGNPTALTPVNSTNLPANSISIAIPAGALPGTYNGTVSVENSFGCGATGKPFSFVINPRPVLALSGTANICQGGSTTLTFNVPASGYSGTLLANGTGSPINLTASGSTLTVTVSPTVTTTYTLASLSNGTCNSIAADLTGSYLVTVTNPPSFSAAPATSTICVGSPASINVTASAIPTGHQWEYRTSATGTWTALTNTAPYSGVTTATLNISAVTIGMIDYEYRDNVSSGTPCNTSVQSSPIKLKLMNVWVGTNSIDWNTGSNWSDGAPPTTACLNTYILTGRNFEPTLSNGALATITNLIIENGTKVTLNNATTGATLQIGGTITEQNPALHQIVATSGRIEFNGTTGAQNILGSYFTTNTAQNMTVNNSSSVNVAATAADSLNITGELLFGKTSALLNTGNNVTLKSTATATANIGPQAATNVITGSIAVERYLINGRKWRLLSVPTVRAGQTIENSWLESRVVPGPTGYGFQAADIRSDFYARGFDVLGTNTSVKIFDDNIADWVAIDNTKGNMNAYQGYIVFVPGDRQVVFPGSSATTLRTRGALRQGTQPPITVPGGKFAVVGNPFASRINVKQILNNSTNLAKAYYIWDPSIAGGYGLGGFRTITQTPGCPACDYETFFPSPLYAVGAYNNVESGSAFLVSQNTSGTGSLTIGEADKGSGSSLLTFTAGERQAMNVYLNVVANNTAPVLVDAAKVEFHDGYGNGLNGYDVKKIASFNEGVYWRTAGEALVVERRNLPTNEDTLRMEMIKMRVQNYQWELHMDNMDYPGRQAYLVDRYLNKTTELDMTGKTVYSFNVVNIPAAYAIDRFYIVFKQQVVLPVTFVDVKASKNADRTIAVQWKVENELNIDQYEVQRSADGSRFTGILTKAAAGNTGGSMQYAVNDLSPLAADNFYRVKALGKDGKEQYSGTVKVTNSKMPSLITVFPNPIEEKTLHLQLKNIEAGAAYQVQLYSLDGKLQFSSKITAAAGNSSQAIKMDRNIAGGSYRLVITDGEGVETRIPVLIQ